MAWWKKHNKGNGNSNTVAQSSVHIHPSVDHGFAPGSASFSGGTLRCKCARDPVEITIASFGLARAIANGVGNVAQGLPAIKCKNSEPYSSWPSQWAASASINLAM